MFNHFARSSELSEPDRARIEQAAAMLGLEELRWKRHGLEVRVRGSEAAPRRSVQAEALQGALVGAQGRSRPVEVALALCRELALSPPPSALGDWSELQSLIVPRLVHPRELSGPRRGMCRREVFGGLLLTASIGRGAEAPRLTTPILDRWPVGFEEVIARGQDNLSEWASPELVSEIEGAPGLLALAGTPWPAASGALVMGSLCPEVNPEHGVIFSVPDQDVLLILPAVPGAGVDGLAGLVQATHSMHAQAGDALSDQMFWARAQEVIPLPVTMVEERDSRRVHLEARGPLAELMRLLGPRGA